MTLAAPEALAEAARLLRTVFGFPSFLPNQEEIVAAILDRRDAFVVMPTGGGKSLCYQLPAHMLPGACLVISPLISLMKDQVDAAVAMGLRASFLNSTLPAAAKRAVEHRLRNGELDLLYVSPERFAMPEFIAMLKQSPLSFVAIDEAHCISEWGHDFRPDYLNLATLVPEFPDVPVAAFTATATHRVQEDIVARLGLRSPHLVRASFNRPNLFYKVVPKTRPGDQILKFIAARPGEPGIVYRTTRSSVEETAAMLTRHGVRALPYHAGLEDGQRARNQDAFNRDEVEVIVATVAFGMGIDKSNVRYVLHADLPKNLESYYQETGRSGRDGEPAHCLLLFGYGDIPKIRFFIDKVEDENEKQRLLKGLNDVIHYATVYTCRRKQLLGYFGEALDAAASGPACCDVCAGEVERVDATEDAQMIMSAIARTGERFGINHVVDVVTGADTERVRRLGHDRIKTYGVGKDRDKAHWRLVIDNLLAQGLIRQSDGEYPVLRLEDSARGVLFENQPVHILRAVRRSSARRGKAAAAAEAPYDQDLFARLRELRKQLAEEQGVPPYVVFSDRSLHEMARFFPTAPGELLDISGVGETKLARYGEAFLAAIREYKDATADEAV